MKYIVLWVGMNEDFVKGSRDEIDMILLCYVYKPPLNMRTIVAIDKRGCD